MKSKEVGDITVSVFKEFYDTNLYEISLKQALVDVPKRFIKSMTELRAIEDETVQKREKLKFPMFTASAVCGYDPATGKGSRRREFAVKKNPILVIDIDKQDNPNIDMDSLKQQLIKVDSVYCVCKSIRGGGLFVVMLIQYPDKLKEHFDAIYNDFLSIGIVVDNKCKDLTRARFISYDESMLIKGDEEEIKPYTKLIEESSYIKEAEENKLYRHEQTLNANRLMYAMDMLFDECLYCGTGDYNDWIHEAFMLASLIDTFGYAYCFEKFMTFSRNTPGFKNSDDVKKKFDNIVNTGSKSADIDGYYFGKLKRQLGNDWVKLLNDYIEKRQINKV